MTAPGKVHATEAETVTERLVEKVVMVTVVLEVLQMVKNLLPRSGSTVSLDSSSLLLLREVSTAAAVASSSWAKRSLFERRSLRPIQGVRAAAPVGGKRDAGLM